MFARRRGGARGPARWRSARAVACHGGHGAAPPPDFRHRCGAAQHAPTHFHQRLACGNTTRNAR
eukprot:1730737-Pyramimonas_sp.AAC.1